MPTQDELQRLVATAHVSWRREPGYLWSSVASVTPPVLFHRFGTAENAGTFRDSRSKDNSQSWHISDDRKDTVLQKV